MKTSLKALLVAAVCVSLSACESLETFSSSPDKGKTTVSSSGLADGYADVDMTYGHITREMSSGSVEIYGFDEPMAPGGGRAFDGGVVANDPNVTVYPIGDMPGYGTEVQPAPMLMPPSEHMQRVESPFGGALQEPAVIDSGYQPEPSMPMPPMVATTSSAPVQPVRPAPRTERSRIYFGHGSSRISHTGTEIIDHVAQTSRGPVSVEGHASSTAEVADPVERRIVNLKMSMDRAFEVSKNLIRKGVPFDHITTKAYGEALPSEPLSGVDQEAANRRVEIVQRAQEHAFVPARAPVGAPAPVYPLEEPTAPDSPIPPLSRY